MTLDMLFPVICYQVYLVVGGYPDIASTELLIDGLLAWTMTGPLPRPLWGLQVVSITVSNKIIATGRIFQATFCIDTSNAKSKTFDQLSEIEH